MTTFQFKKYLDPETAHNLPGPLKKKIDLFEKLRESSDSSDIKKLEELDREITYDLMEEYQERLVNNELESEFLVDNKKPATQKEKGPPPGDALILESLFRSGKSKGLSRNYLLSLGLTDPKTIQGQPLGSFTLVRSGVFSFTYNIVKS